MQYRARRHWPSVLGVAAAIATLLIGLGLQQPGAGLTAGALCLAAGFGVQVLVEHRSGILRERRLVTIAADLRTATAELERLATTDPLTGVLNRRAFFEALGAEFRRAQRYGRDLSVVMIDVDDFKRANDLGGHLFGDYLLAETARLIAANTRESDVVARYGGEEFVVMLPETDEAGAAAAAEKLIRAVDDSAYRSDDFPPHGRAPYRVTASAGLACGPVEPGQDETELVRRADEALYAAKAGGKNRVHCWAPAGAREAAGSGS